jgi:hypothetical protein
MAASSGLPSLARCRSVGSITIPGQAPRLTARQHREQVDRADLRLEMRARSMRADSPALKLRCSLTLLNAFRDARMAPHRGLDYAFRMGAQCHRLPGEERPSCMVSRRRTMLTRTRQQETAAGPTMPAPQASATPDAHGKAPAAEDQGVPVLSGEKFL